MEMYESIKIVEKLFSTFGINKDQESERKKIYVQFMQESPFPTSFLDEVVNKIVQREKKLPAIALITEYCEENKYYKKLNENIPFVSEIEKFKKEANEWEIKLNSYREKFKERFPGKEISSFVEYYAKNVFGEDHISDLKKFGLNLSHVEQRLQG